MKVIDYIHIKNTFGHKDSKIFFKEGRNYLVGPIGSGKSVVLECIAFAFFGVVALRDSSSVYKDIYVELQFTYNEEIFKIVRKINDASLQLLDKTTNEFSEIANSTSVVNQKIIELLGYNYDIFLLSNYCKQKKLSHFSEMTPAKRLQYIDKISGLEESKELLSYLNTKRKSLKERITDFEKLIIKPQLADGIDLDFDYESHIDILNSRLQKLYQLYVDINNITIPYLKKPELILTSFENSLETLSDDETELVKEIIHSIENIENQIRNTTSELNTIPRLSVVQNQYSLKDAQDLIEQNKYQTIKEAYVNLTCPSCSYENLSSLFVTAPVSSLESVSYSDLRFIIDYYEKGYNELIGTLEDGLNTLEVQLNIHKSNLPSFIDLDKVSSNSFQDSIKNLKIKKEKYQLEYSNYTEEERIYNERVTTKQALEEQVNSLVETQVDDINKKDLYLKLFQSKNQYLEQMDFYLSLESKLANLQIEFDLIVSLIKQVTELSLNIKNQTIPLINYHASKNLRLISKGSMSKIEITPNYDLIIDGSRVGVKSGGQQDLASLAFRLSLSKSIVTGMLPLFLADEVDSAGGESDSDDIIEAINEISYNGFQIIMTTHKNTNNLENTNIIRL